MPIDANIPLSFRAPPMDVFGAYEQGQRISANDLAYAGNQRVDDMQQVAYRDQLVARAARMGAASPQDWDRAFGELAQKFPGAERYIGQWSPDAAERLMGGLGGAGPQQPGQGIGGGGPAPGVRQGQNQPAQSGGPTGPQIDFNSVSPEERRTRYGNLSAGIRALNNVRSAQDFEKFFDEMREVIPNVEQIRDSLRSTSQLNDLSWAGSAQRLQNNWKAIVAQLEPIIMAEAGGVPIREAQPGYDVKMSEAGPLLQTTPLGGGPPSMDFMDIGGKGRKEFMPAPSGGGGGAGGVSDLYGADGQLKITPQERKAYQYAADIFRRTQKMVPLGQGKSGTRARSIVLALASEAAGPGGAAFDIGTGADIRASQMSLGQLQKLTDNVTAFEHLMLKNMETVERVMPEGIGGAWPWLNRWVQTGRTQFGDENVPAYATALITVLTEYAKIMSGATGAAGITDSAREEALQMLSPDFNKDQVREVFEVIRTDAENRKVTLYDKLKEVRNRIRTTGTAGEGREPSVDDTTKKNKPSWAP